MARDDIIGGLKSALLRGYSLKDAMISFYNAGYSKEDIESAARDLQQQTIEQPELRSLLSNRDSSVASPSSSGPSAPGAAETPASASNIQRVESIPPARPKSPKTPETISSEPSIKPAPEEKPIPQKARNENEIPEPQVSPEKEKSSVGIPMPKDEKPASKFKPLHVFQQKPVETPKEKKKLAKSLKEGTGLRVATLTLISLLVILLGLLAAIFIFKDQIIQFFNNLLK